MSEMKTQLFTEEEIVLLEANPPKEIFHGITIDKLEESCYVSYIDGISRNDPLSIKKLIEYMKNNDYPEDSSFALGVKKAIKKQKFNDEMKEIINE